MSIEASKMRFETNNAYSQFDTYNSYKKASLFDYNTFGLSLFPNNNTGDITGMSSNNERKSLLSAGKAISQQPLKFNID